MDQHQLMICWQWLPLCRDCHCQFFPGAQAAQPKSAGTLWPEYDRVVKKEGEVRKAEGVLEMRAKRREKFELRPLSAQAAPILPSIGASSGAVCGQSEGFGDARR